jgi:hypothetical protein
MQADLLFFEQQLVQILERYSRSNKKLTQKEGHVRWHRQEIFR